MPIRVIYTLRCYDCFAMIAPIDIDNIRTYERTGYIYNENELEEVNIINNIVQCRQCGKGLGIKRIDNNEVILFKQYLGADAFIQTRS